MDTETRKALADTADAVLKQHGALVERTPLLPSGLTSGVDRVLAVGSTRPWKIETLRGFQYYSASEPLVTFKWTVRETARKAMRDKSNVTIRTRHAVGGSDYIVQMIVRAK